MGGPRLHAVDDELVAVSDRLGAQSSGIGATGGLRQAISAQLAAAEHVRQPPVPLLCRADGSDREAGQGVYADAETDREPRARQLFQHLQVGLVRLPAAPDFLGIRQAEKGRLGRSSGIRPAETGCRSRRRLRADAARHRQGRDEAEQRGSCVVSGLPFHARHRPATTTSSRVTLLSRWAPASVHTTMSSIRAPWGPG